MDRRAWDERYASRELLWGAEPNRFVAAELQKLPPGRALDVACGEGRNAIWLATLGWTVTGVDFSPVALERARRLAGRAQIGVEWIEADVTTFAPTAGDFDLVLIAYLQLPADPWRRALAAAAAALAPGGTLFMIGHALRNLALGVGGPQSPDVLWDPEPLRRQLLALGLDVERVEEVRRPVETAEGMRDALDVLARARRHVTR